MTLKKLHGLPWNPEPYQRRAMRHLLQNAAAGLLLDPGLGKTSITLGAIKVLKKERVGHGTLVLAPLRPAQRVWPDEQQKWKDFHGLSMAVLHGPHKEKLLAQQHDVYVINYEGLPWLLENRAARLKDLIKRCDVHNIVYDELSKFKHSNTKRFKMVRSVLQLFSRRWGLTGSPAARSYMDLFGECFVLDGGHALGPYVTHYRTKYFEQHPHQQYDWSLRKGAEQEIKQAIAPLMLTLEAEDYVQLPQQRDSIVQIHLPPKARAQYDDMEEEMFLQLSGGAAILAANKGVAMGRCRQITSGAMYTAGAGSAFEELHTEKMDAAEELFEELNGQQLLLTYEFQHTKERLLKRFGKKAVCITDAKGAAYQKLEDAWNAGQLPLAIGQQSSLYLGLNLQGSSAAHVGFVDVPWDYEMYDQLIRRLRRRGSQAAYVTAHHFVARNTVDEYCLGVLRRKAKTEKEFKLMFKNYQSSRK